MWSDKSVAAPTVSKIYWYVCLFHSCKINLAPSVSESLPKVSVWEFTKAENLPKVSMWECTKNKHVKVYQTWERVYQKCVRVHQNWVYQKHVRVYENWESVYQKGVCESSPKLRVYQKWVCESLPKLRKSLPKVRERLPKVSMWEFTKSECVRVTKTESLPKVSVWVFTQIKHGTHVFQRFIGMLFSLIRVKSTWPLQWVNI